MNDTVRHSSKFTRDEHETRAALLGRYYDPSDHTYNSDEMALSVICAETLEELVSYESNPRRHETRVVDYPGGNDGTADEEGTTGG